MKGSNSGLLRVKDKKICSFAVLQFVESDHWN